jgi:hypothetical protein
LIVTLRSGQSFRRDYFFQGGRKNGVDSRNPRFEPFRKNPSKSSKWNCANYQDSA